MAYEKRNRDYIGDDVMDLDEEIDKTKKSLSAIKLTREEFDHYRKTDESVADDLLD